ncbi:MAG: hypothetical protein KY461_10860 [Actinobacteria bacterium]|nr:hypothetical protein [Actinomycetota bacterium]
MDTTPRSEPMATPPTASARSLVSEIDPTTAAFLATVRDTYRTPLPSDVTSSHLRMILAEAAVSPAQPALRDWARRARRIAAVGAVKIALTATAAAAAAGTGLAATGSLPDAAQTVVAGIAEQVGLTFPVPAADTPGDRTDAEGDPQPGIGEGGLPGLLDSGADEGDLPGEAGDAPAFERDADGRPITPAQDGRETAEDRRNAGNASGTERGEDRADERPAAPAPASRPDTAGDTSGDAPAADGSAEGTPADEQPEAPAPEPAAPAGGAAPDEAGDDDAPGTAGEQRDATDD